MLPSKRYVVNCQLHPAPQFPFNAQARLRQIRRVNIRGHPHNARWRLARRARHARIRERGVWDHQFPNSRAFREQGLLGDGLAQALVKDSGASAQDGLLVPRGEAEPQARRNVVHVIEIRLPSVAHAKREVKVWAQLYIILEEAVYLLL